MVKSIEIGFLDIENVLLGIHLMNGEATNLETGDASPAPTIMIGFLFFTIYIFL